MMHPDGAAATYRMRALWERNLRYGLKATVTLEYNGRLVSEDVDDLAKYLKEVITSAKQASL